jgi:hypothetical protein
MGVAITCSCPIARITKRSKVLEKIENNKLNDSANDS